MMNTTARDQELSDPNFAERIFQESLGKDPNYFDSMVMSAAVFVFQGKEEKARDQIKRVNKLEPHFTFNALREQLNSVVQDPNKLNELLEAVKWADLQ